MEIGFVEKLIKGDIDLALVTLKQVFGDNNGFPVLRDEYIFQSKDFNLFKYSSRLKVFVNLYQDEIEKWQPNHGYDDLDNRLEFLSEIDFKDQSNYFEDISKRNRGFFVFAVRGNGKCGQRWLLHQLIDNYVVHYHKHITIDLVEMNMATNDEIIGNILKQIDVDPKKDKFDIKCQLAIKRVLQRLDTNNQCIVFKNFHSYISNNSREFSKFYDNFLNMLCQRVFIDEITTKLIILFVEETETQYDVPAEVEIDWRCIYLEKINKDVAFASLIPEWNAGEYKFDMIGLHPIGPITKEMLQQWIKGPISRKMSDAAKYDELKCKVEQYCGKECFDDNPKNVIEYVANELKYEKWTSY